MSNLKPNVQFERPDPVLTSKIVTLLKSQGIFDDFRRECLADVDTKPAYLNLRQRVEGSVSTFLRENPWKPDMNKNLMRENLRKHIQRGGFLDTGVDRIVDQVVNPKIYSVFLPKVEEVVQSCLEMDKDNKPKFVAPVKVEEAPKPLSVRQRFNLVPSGNLPSAVSVLGPRMPRLEDLKPPDPGDDTEDSLTEEKSVAESSEQEMRTNGSYVLEEDEAEEEEDDEESPPFEPHSENDRMILGVRSDSSENSDVIVERIEGSIESESDKEEASEEAGGIEPDESEENEESDEKRKSEDKEEDIKRNDSFQETDESSSDEYVQKTPTMNTESLDGSVIELNSISEYKKFDEDSFGNVVEEVVESQWADESSREMKEERFSNEGSLPAGSCKRKFNADSFDDPSNSSIDKESSGDEEKCDTVDDVQRKKLKLEESSSDERKYSKIKLEESSSDEGKYDTAHVIEQKNIKLEESSSDEGKYNKIKLEESSSDEGKYDTTSVEKAKMKLEEIKSEYESENEHVFNYPENEDSNISNPNEEDLKLKHSVDVLYEKNKSSISSPKSSTNNHHQHRSRDHHKDHKGSSSHHSSKSRDKLNDKEDKESSGSSHSSRSKKDEKLDSSKSHNKDRERKKSESSSSRHSEDHERSRHEKDKDEKHREKKKADKHDSVKGEKDSSGKDKRDSKYDHYEKRSRDLHDKVKKHHNTHSHEKVPDGKGEHISTYKHDKDNKESSKSSKHSHSSSKHSHKSSSEKRKSDKDEKHRHSSDRHKDSDKKSENESKRESKKKHRDQCKTSEKEDSRRSSDRDSNGPSDRSFISSRPASKSSSSKCDTGSSVDFGERTSSNSDNTVSDHVETPKDDNSKNDKSEQYTTSPDKKCVQTAIECNLNALDEMESKEAIDDQIITSSNFLSLNKEVEGNRSEGFDQTESNSTQHKRDSDCMGIKLVDNVTPVAGTSSCESDGESSEQYYSVPGSSIHDTSSEKENCELAINFKEAKNNGAGSLESTGEKVIKFKKPKIAKNIFELKKIMAARRNFKRVEQKRIKLLKNNSEEITLESVPTSGSTVNEDGDNSEDGFKGFEISFSDKTEKYDCLIKRLESEVMNTEICDDNPLIVQRSLSCMDLNSDLNKDDEDVLKTKGLSISEGDCKVNPESDAYDQGHSSTNEEEVDGNLNNVNPAFKSKQNFSELGTPSVSLKQKFNGGNLKTKGRNSETNPSMEVEEKISPLKERKSDVKNNSPKVKSPPCTTKETSSESEVSPVVESVSKNSKTSPIISASKQMFSLTFNQTYDEILKEKETTKAEPPTPKTSQTVVKITSSCRSNEQVVVKTIQPNTPQTSKVPRITKSETTVNGKVSSPPTKQKQMPLISRINKNHQSGPLPPTVGKSHPLNGSISPGNAPKKEEESRKKITAELISSVIGIHTDTSSKEPAKKPTTPPKEQRTARRGRPPSSKVVTQRYDSEDLYKPRPQVSGRRGRGRPPLVTETPPILVPVATRKRGAAAKQTSPAKRRR